MTRRNGAILNAARNCVKNTARVSGNEFPIANDILIVFAQYLIYFSLNINFAYGSTRKVKNRSKLATLGLFLNVHS